SGRPSATGKQHFIARDSSGRLHLIFRNKAGTRLYHTTSVNNGLSWSAPALIFRGTSLEGAIALDRLDRLHLVWGNSSLDNGCALYAEFTNTQWISPTFLGPWPSGRNVV